MMAFIFLGQKNAKVVLCERQLQPGFVLEGLGAEANHSRGSRSLNGGNPPHSLFTCSYAGGRLQSRQV